MARAKPLRGKLLVSVLSEDWSTSSCLSVGRKWAQKERGGGAFLYVEGGDDSDSPFTFGLNFQGGKVSRSHHNPRMTRVHTFSGEEGLVLCCGTV